MTLRRQVRLSTTMLVGALTGYGGRAYAACVINPALPFFVCSGANPTTQTITANDADVSTVPGFSVVTADSIGLIITGGGAISYTDANQSPLTAADVALNIDSSGNIGGGNQGSVTVNTNGILTAGNVGIFSHIFGSGTGALTITANGDVTGTNNIGIYARNFNGTDLSVTTGAGTTVTGQRGIDARNYGIGALAVTANGDVTGTTVQGISARNFGTDLSVTTGAGTTVMGMVDGILARNYGSGALTITANGDVTGTTVQGIIARNFNGTDLTVTTGVGTTVSAGDVGIFARNHGSGELTVTANGDVASGSDGIYARNFAAGSDLTVTTGVGTTVMGGIRGINARNYGSGALTITANGDVTGTTVQGIYARNFNGTDLTVTTGVGTTVSAGDVGIFARNHGSGELTVTANGDVASGSDGIYARNFAAGSDLTVTTGVGTTVMGGIRGINARNHGTGSLTVTANGDVASGSDGIYARNFNGSDLTVTTGAGTTVTGGSYGIRAHNFGSGVLTVTTNGDVTDTSRYGIYATSAGTPIAVTVGSASHVTSNGAAGGVKLLGGANNSLVNYGTVSSLSGTAIVAGIGDETVDNFGVVTGNVLLGTGTNAFNNKSGGLFNSGTTVNLGAGNLLTNDGTLSPGGNGNTPPFTTNLTGDFVQTGSGRFAVNLQGANADLLNVTGTGTADLDGHVKPIFTLSGIGANTQWAILTSGTPIVNSGIVADNPAAVTFDLIFPTTMEMDLVLLGVDFAPQGLNRNETAIGNNLNAIYGAGSGGLVNLIDALAVLPSLGGLANALDQLSPEIYLDTEIATLFSSLSFTNSLMTCPVRDGAAAFIKEGECVWARLSGRDFQQDSTTQTLGFEETSGQVAGGGQVALGPVWRIGGALGYEHSNLDTGTNAKAEGDRFSGGAVVKYNPGALLLAAGVSGSLGSYDTDRPIAFPSFSAKASGDNDIDTVDGRFRAAYQLGSGNWYLKPMVDLDATHINLDNVKESGAGGVGLNVRGNDETVLSASPALELGAQFGSPGGTLVRPYIRGGATFFDNTDFALQASFEGSPSGVGPFRIATRTDDVVADVSAGVDVIGARGASLRLYYDGRFGDTVEEHAGGIKASLPF